MFRVKQNILPEILKELFSFNLRNYNLRRQLTLKQIKTNSVYFGSESLSSLIPKIWDLVSDSFKNEKSLESLKNSIKTWITCKCLNRSIRVGRLWIAHIINLMTHQFFGRTTFIAKGLSYSVEPVIFIFYCENA